MHSSFRWAWVTRCLLAAILVSRSGWLFAADWPQFLGPTRNGLSGEQGLVDSFPAEGPRVLWRIPGGVGMSGVAVSQGTACTLVQKDGRQWALAVDAATGQTRWQTSLAPAYENAMGDGPRATPAIDGDFVFTFTGEGVLSALKLSDGSVVWSHNVPRELGGQPAEYGMACSPLVQGGLVIVTAGAPQATVAAYDAKSGELRWKAGEKDAAGYSSPAVLTIQGRPQLVVCTGAAAIGLDPADGRALWRYPWKTDFNCNIATPLEINGRVFISSGENHGSALLKIDPQGGAEAVWTSLGSGSTLRNEWQTSLLIDGVLYGFDNVGSAGPVTHYTCIDPATAQRVWQQPRFGKGNAIAADGKIWATTMNGELVLLRATREGYRELGRAELLETTRQSPSLADGRLYVRDDRDVVCVDVRR